MANSINGNLYDYNNLYGINQTNGVTTPYLSPTADPDAESLFETNLNLTGAEDIDVEAKEDEYLAALGNVEDIDEVNTENEEAKKIQEEIEELKEEKEENIKKMEELEDHIEDLVDSAKENIAKAAALQEAAVKEHQEEVDKVLEEQLNAYIEANKEGGEGMTRDELQANIKGALPNIPEVGDAVAALAAASKEVSEIDSCLCELNKLITDTKLIDDEIKIKEGEYEAAIATPEPDTTVSADDCTPPPTNCEPQGFQDAAGNQYDFFIDKDGNGDLSNESEFLGYEGGKEGQEAAWAEMTNLDVNADGVVDAKELSEAGVMVYKTDANGNQQAMTIEEAFGEDSDLAISTTQHDEAKEGVGPNNFNTGVGSENNELWGTFDVTLNGETLDGYQTNDDLDWLKENYAFTDYADNTTVTDGENSALEYSEELQPHVNFFNEYTEISEQLKTDIQTGYENLGLSQEQMDGINQIAEKEAAEDAKNLFASLNIEDEEQPEDQPVDEEDPDLEEEILEAQAA